VKITKPRARPILLSDRFVRAFLNTRPDVWPAEPIDPAKPFKLQTRRLVKLRPGTPPSLYDAQGVPLDLTNWCECHADGTWFAWCNNAPEGAYQEKHDKFTQHAYPEGGGIVPPHGRAGEYLWFREAHARSVLRTEHGYDDSILYRVDGANIRHPSIRVQAMRQTNKGYRPGRFLPRWAARLFARIERVRIERLQEIAHADIVAEGIAATEARDAIERVKAATATRAYTVGDAYLAAWIEAWDALHAPPFDWASNPYVWVYDFARVTALPEDLAR
jgi:hypothetical protein